MLKVGEMPNIALKYCLDDLRLFPQSPNHIIAFAESRMGMCGYEGVL